jgi:hypothetical protein
VNALAGAPFEKIEPLLYKYCPTMMEHEPMKTVQVDPINSLSIA